MGIEGSDGYRGHRMCGIGLGWVRRALGGVDVTGTDLDDLGWLISRLGWI